MCRDRKRHWLHAFRIPKEKSFKKPVLKRHVLTYHRFPLFHAETGNHSVLIAHHHLRKQTQRYVIARVSNTTEHSSVRRYVTFRQRSREGRARPAAPYLLGGPAARRGEQPHGLLRRDAHLQRKARPSLTSSGPSAPSAAGSGTARYLQVVHAGQADFHGSAGSRPAARARPSAAPSCRYPSPRQPSPADGGAPSRLPIGRARRWEGGTKAICAPPLGGAAGRGCGVVSAVSNGRGAAPRRASRRRAIRMRRSVSKVGIFYLTMKHLRHRVTKYRPCTESEF